jgi:hypothetical protein
MPFKPPCTNDLNGCDRDDNGVTMSTQITFHPPRARCYKCGSTNIESVCHHCRRAMCTLHIRQPVDSRGRLISVEFTGLGLKETCGEVPIHCEFCHHLVHPTHPALLVAGVVVFILALMLPFDLLERFMGILLGTAVAGLGFYIRPLA